MSYAASLYQYADEHNIDVDWCIMTKAASLSVPLFDGTCAIALDPTKLCGSADEAVKLAHELGHCETGSFYNQYAPFDERARHELRADRWAIHKLLPYEVLLDAFEKGYHETWELAEYLDLTEEFIWKAIEYYTGPAGLNFAK